MYDFKQDVEDLYSMLYSDLPSRNMLKHYLSHYTKNDYPKYNEFGGKWLICCHTKEVDKTWKKIKKLQDKNLLGNLSKVSTFLNARSYNNQYVICVYTYDSTDTIDVMRIRNNLNKHGFKTPLNYKRDIETKNNIYGNDNEFLMTI